MNSKNLLKEPHRDNLNELTHHRFCAAIYKKSNLLVKKKASSCLDYST